MAQRLRNEGRTWAEIQRIIGHTPKTLRGYLNENGGQSANDLTPNIAPSGEIGNDALSADSTPDQPEDRARTA